MKWILPDISTELLVDGDGGNSWKKRCSTGVQVNTVHSRFRVQLLYHIWTMDCMDDKIVFIYLIFGQASCARCVCFLLFEDINWHCYSRRDKFVYYIHWTPVGKTNKLTDSHREIIPTTAFVLEHAHCAIFISTHFSLTC